VLKGEPAIPTGIVATMIIQASFWSVPCGAQRLVPARAGRVPERGEEGPMIRTQSAEEQDHGQRRRTCSPTM